MAQIIHQRIDEILAADSFELLLKHKIGRCHRLQGNRRGQIAFDLIHPYRLLTEEDQESPAIAIIIDIVDYH